MHFAGPFEIRVNQYFDKGSWEPNRNRVAVLARQATQPGGIGSLESILGLLKSLKFGLRAWRAVTATLFLLGS